MSTNAVTKESKINVQGLDHFALNVKNMERAEKFYSEVFGFPVIHRTQTQSGLRHTEIDAGNVAIALFELPNLDIDSGQKIMTDDGFLHFAFGSDYKHFDTTLQTLKERGVKFDGEPRDRETTVSVYFFDPDGHQLEICFKK